MPVNLRALLEEMIEKDASDLHIVAGEVPKIRVDGDIVNSSVTEVLTPKDTLSLAYSVLTENQKKRFETESELDFSFGIQNLARFRGNVFKQRGCVSMVIHQIRGREHQPHHRYLPVAPADPDPHPAVLRARGRDHADATAEGEREGPGHGGGDPHLHARDPRAHSRRQGRADPLDDASREETRYADLERRALPALHGARSDQGRVPPRHV